jgi:hypothetical protein
MKHIYSTRLLVLLIIAGSSACRKDPEPRCTLQEGELYRPKMVKEEISFKQQPPYDTPGESYRLYIYNSAGQLTEVQSYDKSDASLYKTTHFLYTSGKISEYFDVDAKNNTPSLHTLVEYKNGNLYKTKNPEERFTYHYDGCNFTRHDLTSEKEISNRIEKYREKLGYGVTNGNITKEWFEFQDMYIYQIDSTSSLPLPPIVVCFVGTYKNYRYYRNKSNQVTNMGVLKPMDYNHNLLREEEKCDDLGGYMYCVRTEFEYDFDAQNRITKITGKEKGKVISERWFYYE